MTTTAKAAFFSEITTAMFQFKQLTSRDEKLRNTPSLGTTGLGTTYVSSIKGGSRISDKTVLMGQGKKTPSMSVGWSPR